MISTSAPEFAFAAINLIIYLALFVGIPVLIGVYVYRDAHARGMNAALWTLVAVLAPMLIGFIIYLLVRGSYSDIKCPRCETRVKEDYTVCPQCGAKLRATCNTCGFPLAADWSICPKCAAPVTEIDPDVTPPIKKQDRTLSKILIAIILIPVMVILLLLFGIASFSSNVSAQSIGVSEWATTEYAYNPQVSEWIQECDRNPDAVYVLRSQDKHANDHFTRYLIYRPGASQSADVDADTRQGFFKSKMQVEFTSTGAKQTESPVVCVTFTGDKPVKSLTVKIDGEKTRCRIQDIDYNISRKGAV